MRKYVLRFLIIYKRIANAYTRCRRITNPTERGSGKMGAPDDPNTCTCFVKWVHLFSQMGAPVLPNTCTCFSYIFNLSLDLWSLAKQECFSCKDTTNGTVQSDFPFFSFDSFLFVRFVSFRSIRCDKPEKRVI